MKPAAFSYQRPENLDEALDELGRGDVMVKAIAGSQTLGPILNLRLARPEALIDVSQLAELAQVSDSPESVRFGAAVTHAAIEDGLHPDPVNGGMRQVARGIAYRVVRNRGTLGGSLAHADPSADWLSFMTVADAVVHTRSPRGERELPLSEFVLAAYTTQLTADEIIIAIELPRYSESALFGYHKVCRKVGEFADAIGTVLIDPQRRYCRIVAGAIAPRPLILDELAAQLASTATLPALESIKAAVTRALPDAEPVKQHLGAVCIQRALSQAGLR